MKGLKARLKIGRLRVEKQKNSTECTQLYPQKMSRWLSPHPDGWDVKPEVPGDLASRGICLFQTLVSHNSGKPGRVVQFQFQFLHPPTRVLRMIGCSF